MYNSSPPSILPCYSLTCPFLTLALSGSRERTGAGRCSSRCITCLDYMPATKKTRNLTAFQENRDENESQKLPSGRGPEVLPKEAWHSIWKTGEVAGQRDKLVKAWGVWLSDKTFAYHAQGPRFHPQHSPHSPKRQ